MGPTPASSFPQKLFATGEVTSVSSIHLIYQSITTTGPFRRTYWKRIQDRETVGPSATVPGIFVQFIAVGSIESRLALLLNQSYSNKRRKCCNEQRTTVKKNKAKRKISKSSDNQKKSQQSHHHQEFFPRSHGLRKEWAEQSCRSVVEARPGMAASPVFTAPRLSGQPAGYLLRVLVRGQIVCFFSFPAQ